MPGHLAGRVAVVTGSGGGIGREHALALAAEGARVVVNDLGVDLDGSGGSPAPAEEVAAEIRKRGGEAVANCDSVADYASSERIVRAATHSFGRLDILVNNASVFRDGPFQNMTPTDWEADLAVHLTGTFNMCKHALAVMQEQKHGRIINTTSSAWYTGVGFAAYAAAKGGIVSLTYDLAAEYWRDGITVNAIAPGAATQHRLVQGQRWMASLVAAGLAEPSPAETTRSEPGAPPPEFVPPMLVYLASDDAAHVSGMVFETIGSSIGVYSHPSVVQRVHKDPDTGPWTQEELRRVLPESILAGPTRAPHIRE